jgi:hypothetical protein
MAEIKNTFLKSKMNKDLDHRLIPNGEYRDAQNISVGKSEDDDVGALENIIGNSKAVSSIPYNTAIFDIIGYYSDSINNRVITFVTSYTDPYTNGQHTSVSEANNASPAPNPLYNCHICVFDKQKNSYSIIVTGEFLNFSTTDRVLGVSLIEDLLFFTDNRNQPRKINLTTALSSASSDHYTSEDSISVAKYNPYQPISLLKKAVYKVSAASTNSKVVTFSSVGADVQVGMTVVGGKIADGLPISGLAATNFVTVESLTSTTVTLRKQSAGDVSLSLQIGDEITFLSSTMSNKESDANWPGDPDFMEERFIRFSYRFRFEDGEYSISAPFTQIAYVPKQKGYFFSGDEDSAYKSTVVDFMENNVNNVELIIPLPSKGSLLSSQYKISSVDILYKESDALALKVLETVKVSSIASDFPETNNYVYDYQSRKPYRTLPSSEVTRVYDKTPVRAFAQETTGNRVMYANFRDKHTPPSSLNYSVGVFKKDTINDYGFVEYPNHTVKQNRNYQVGFVLSDKFGRQSPVILSPVVKTDSSNVRNGSTFYHDYNSSSDDVLEWFGDQVQVKVNEVISSGTGLGYPNLTTGEPGLYAVPLKATGSGDGFSISLAPADAPFFTNNNKTYNYKLNPTGSTTGSSNVNTNVPVVGSYLRGAYKDYVKVTAVTGSGGYNMVICDGEISDIYLRKLYVPAGSLDLKFAFRINPTGWYSYKLVVKQSQQEYYNVYSAGAMKGLPFNYDQNHVTPITSEDTSFISLLNDNINKIPRDLNEVGPQDKTFRSSVELYGRVQNDALGNSQFFPGRTSFVTSSIEDLYGLFDVAEFKTSTRDLVNIPITSKLNPFHGFYKSDSDPFIAEINTSKDSNLQFGVNNSVTTSTVTANTTSIVNDDVSIPVDNETGSISIGSIITEINGTAVTAETDYVVVNTTNGVNPTLTLNRAINLSNNDLIQFTERKYNDISTLAILETPPTISLLDIFWETSTTGLISDLNDDVLTSFEGVSDISSVSFNYVENQDINGTSVVAGAIDSPYVTNYFYPLSLEGEELSNTGLLSGELSSLPSGSTGSILSVVDANDNVVQRFRLEQNTDTGSSDLGAYRCRIVGSNINSQTDVGYSSSIADQSINQFTFNLEFFDNNGEWSGPFSFEGSMTNSNPYLYSTLNTPVSSLVLSTIKGTAPNARESTFLDYLGGTNRVYISNGAFTNNSIGNETRGVGVYYNSVPKIQFDQDSSPWKLQHTTGKIALNGFSINDKPSIYGGTQVGHYDLTFKVKDAMTNIGGSGFQRIGDDGTTSDNTKNSSVYSQKVIIEPDRVPTNLVNTCLYNGLQPDPDNSVNGNRYAATSNLAPNTDPGYKEAIWQWYISPHETVTKPRGATDQEDLGPTTDPAFIQYYPHRLGNDAYGGSKSGFTSGTMLLDFMFEVTNASVPKTYTNSCSVSWKIWYRESTSDTWEFGALNTNNQVISEMYRSVTAGGTIATATSSVNIPMAFDKLGEYFIECKVLAYTKNYTKAWVNVSDANYPTCVPLYGRNLIEEAGGSGLNADYFKFNYSTTVGSAVNCSTLTNSSVVYSRTPYPHVTTQLYLNTGLEDFISPTPALGRRKYDFNASGGEGNLSFTQLNLLSEPRIASFNSVTQETTSGNSKSVSGYKTNVFYVDTDDDDSKWRDACNTSYGQYQFFACSQYERPTV